ncbi:hypothetical protein ACFVWR_01525 [Leifsonia sp. NPDC058292]
MIEFDAATGPDAHLTHPSHLPFAAVLRVLSARLMVFDIEDAGVNEQR